MDIKGKVPKSIINKAQSINKKYGEEVIYKVSVEYDCAGETGMLYWAYSAWTNTSEESGTITAETAKEMVSRLGSEWVKT